MFVAFLLIAATGSPAAQSTALDNELATERREMIRAIEVDVERTSRKTGRRSLDSRVLDILGRVPRHEFVPPRYRRSAYQNRPLPIGFGQTISQPYIVALMTDLLEVDSDSKVLEIGTGSGYQAAVLAELGAKVLTIEILPALGRQAAERFERLGYDGIETRIGDGYFGWQEEAPFDGIIVTAAADHVPPPLVQQLKPGGRMIIPVGRSFSIQHLLCITKQVDGSVKTRQILPVAFVPLTGEH